MVRWLLRSSHSRPNRKPSRGTAGRFVRPAVEGLEERLAPAGLAVVGAGEGQAPLVRLFDAETGANRGRFLAYQAQFRGGVRVALGDVTHDGVPDIITAPGVGGVPFIKVFSGRDLTPVAAFRAFGPGFRGGVHVAVGDVNHDGLNEIITAMGPGGLPRVRCFVVLGGRAAQIPGPLGNFLAYHPAFHGGVTVAAGDVDGKPGDELITGAGPGGGPHVNVFGADGRVQASFFAFPPQFRGGVFVAAGDVNRDGRADIVTGAGAGGLPFVTVFNGRNGAVLHSFLAFSPSFRGGVRVAVDDVTADGRAEILALAGEGGSARMRLFDGQGFQPLFARPAFAAGFVPGVYGAVAGVETRGGAAQFQVNPEAPLLSRLARFVPTAVPTVSSWAAVNASDSNLDPNSNGGKSHLYVIAHGWAPGFLTMVQMNGTATNPLKWWQTLNTALPGSPGSPASPEMFYGSSGDGIQITPTGLAYAITQADPKAVVLAYSWIDDSATADFLGAVPKGAYLSEAYTALNGTRLARALQQALPAAFQSHGGQLHLIGHSHGSKVATVAADVLTQTGNANFAVAHLTLLDSPETDSFLVRQGDAANNLWYFLGGLNIGRSAGQTFVDNYISEFDKRLGVVQGFNPLNTSQKKTVLQQLVDVTLNGGVLFNPTDLGSLHGYAFTWYAGGSQPWAQNPTPTVADQWSPLINPATPPTLAGSYTQSWTKATQPQFALTPGSKTNTVSDTPQFTNLTFSKTTVTSGSSFNANTGTVVLTENGSSGATFTGKFSPGSNLAGLSFNFQFTNPGAGDQLVISVDTGLLFSYQVYYVMTGTVAGTALGFGTLSLTSLAGSYFDHTVQIQLLPASGSSGASVTITNMQQFTS